MGGIAFLEVFIKHFGFLRVALDELHKDAHLLVGDDDGLQIGLAQDTDAAVERTGTEGLEVVAYRAEEIVVGQQVDFVYGTVGIGAAVDGLVEHTCHVERLFRMGEGEFRQDGVLVGKGLFRRPGDDVQRIAQLLLQVSALVGGEQVPMGFLVVQQVGHLNLFFFLGPVEVGLRYADFEVKEM